MRNNNIYIKADFCLVKFDLTDKKKLSKLHHFIIFKLPLGRHLKCFL